MRVAGFERGSPTCGFAACCVADVPCRFLVPPRIAQSQPTPLPIDYGVTVPHGHSLREPCPAHRNGGALYPTDELTFRLMSSPREILARRGAAAVVLSVIFATACTRP